jgi:hypothetical protein
MAEHANLNHEVISWALDALAAHGYKLISNVPETVQSTPWSNVLRFLTSDVFVYLKQTPKLISLEAKIIKTLHTQFAAPVPEIIAENTELNCFLMADAGRKLRDIIKLKFDANIVCKAIANFTALQVTVAEHVDVFIDLGVPDWHLNKLPKLYQELLNQKDLLLADGLSKLEISELEALVSQVARLCEELSSYGLPQTIVQPDCNDNNTLIDVLGNITIIDLGEIVISHPFFSLPNFLYIIKKHHGIREEDFAYIQIKDASLSNYLPFGTKKELLDALAIAKKIWGVYEALAIYRLMLACGIEKIMALQPGKLKVTLQELQRIIQND